jgi:hypothetical protein
MIHLEKGGPAPREGIISLRIGSGPKRLAWLRASSLVGAAVLFGLATPAAKGDLINLGANIGDTATVNGAVFTVNNSQSAGTGLITSFLCILNNGTEQGYNTGTPRGTFPAGFPDFDQRKGTFTFDIALGTIPKTTDSNFRRLLLDINQSASNPTIDLERLLIFVGGGPNAFINGDLSQLVDGGPFGSLIFDLDSSGDHTVRITDVFAGSGQFDASIDIPETLFTGKNANEVFRVFANFTNASDTYEEFAAQGLGGGGGSPFPEPGSIILSALGVLGLAGFRWFLRRRVIPV